MVATVSAVDALASFLLSWGTGGFSRRIFVETFKYGLLGPIPFVARSEGLVEVLLSLLLVCFLALLPMFVLARLERGCMSKVLAGLATLVWLVLGWMQSWASV